MTERARKAWSSYSWGVLGTVGLALIAAAVLLLASSGPVGPSVPVVHAQTETPTVTPTVTPTPNDGCILDVRKSDDPDPVAEGGEITYTITVENDGDSECEDIEVTDEIPDDTDCVDAYVDDSSDIDEDDIDVDGCDSSGNVTWETDEELDDGDEIVLVMVVELTSGADDGDEIENEVCVEGYDPEMEAYEPGDCDTEKTDVEGEAATATPGPTSTPYVWPTVAPTVAPPVIPPAPVPVAEPAAQLVAPPTGSGSASGGGMADTIALALGLTGGALLLVSGAGLWARRPR
jgi:fimbrial isopeptide formation D2 family protein